MVRKGQPVSISYYLGGLTAGIVIPFVLFVVLLLWQLQQREERELAQRAHQTAALIATSVERNLRDMATTLRVLTTSVHVHSGDLAALHGRTQAALAGGVWHLIAVDPEGNQLLNTRVPFGTPLGKTSHMDSLVSALETGRVRASEVFFGQTSQRWVFNVIRPLDRPGPAGIAALILTQDAGDLASFVNVGPLPDNWNGALVDRNGRLIIGTDQNAGRQGEALSVPLGVPDAASGSVQFDTDSGEIMAGYASLTGWSWMAVVWGPVATGRASVIGGWTNLLVGGLILSAVAGLIVMAMTNRLRRVIRRLSRMARAIGEGEIVSPVRTGILELDQVADSLSEASYDRSQDEARLRFVMHEVVHRSKNMLTVVQAMIRQSSRKQSSIDAFLPVVTERLGGLARSLDLLVAEEWKGVPLRVLLRAQIASFVDEEDRVRMSGEDILLKSDVVQHLGLAIHELATNAVKYGALSSPGGRVRIDWEIEQSEFRITWQEEGGPPVSEPEARGFGSTVIESYVASAVGGHVTFTFDPGGIKWTLRAPASSIRQSEEPAEQMKPSAMTRSWTGPPTDGPR